MATQRPNIHAIDAKLDILLKAQETMRLENKSDFEKIHVKLDKKADKVELRNLTNRVWKVAAAVSALIALAGGGAKAAFGAVRAMF